MKKALLAFALMAVCVMYSNVAVANTVSSDNVSIEVAPDPAQKIIDRLNQWTVLSQSQMDQIIVLSANYEWTSIATSEAFKAQVKLLKADIRDLISDPQFQEIKDAQGGN